MRSILLFKLYVHVQALNSSLKKKIKLNIRHGGHVIKSKFYVVQAEEVNKHIYLSNSTTNELELCI